MSLQRLSLLSSYACGCDGEIALLRHGNFNALTTFSISRKAITSSRFMVAAAGKLYDLGPIDAASWNQLCFSYDAEVREIVVVFVSTVLYPNFSLFCTPTNVFLRHMHRNTVHL